MDSDIILPILSMILYLNSNALEFSLWDITYRSLPKQWDISSLGGPAVRFKNMLLFGHLELISIEGDRRCHEWRIDTFSISAVGTNVDADSTQMLVTITYSLTTYLLKM